MACDRVLTTARRITPTARRRRAWRHRAGAGMAGARAGCIDAQRLPGNPCERVRGTRISRLRSEQTSPLPGKFLTLEEVYLLDDVVCGGGGAALQRVRGDGPGERAIERESACVIGPASVAAVVKNDRHLT